MRLIRYRRSALGVIRSAEMIIDARRCALAGRSAVYFFRSSAAFCAADSAAAAPARVSTSAAVAVTIRCFDFMWLFYQ